jgi:phosphoadenosine phosphosulfate reductase
MIETDDKPLARELSAALPSLDLAQRLALIAERVAGRIVFTTSFGIEDQAITHAIFSGNVAIEVVTLDTGRLFPETYDVWGETEERYARRIRAVYPERDQLEALIADQGINGFRMSIDTRKACCGVRKVLPLARALEGAGGWVTGLRAGQSQGRAQTPFAVAHDFEGRIGLKLSPLADWSREEVERYIADNAIPYNILHDRGFPSIGCAPCTRAVRVGEEERAGRWWWEREGAQECGLHAARAVNNDIKADASAIRRAS